MPRYIPADVRRKLRKEAGFGCARCGFPVVDYHHIVPWAVEQHNRVEDMVLLCPAHHDECSKGAILEAEQRQWKASPRNVVQGYADGLLKINHSYCALDCGSCLLVNDGVHFIVDGEPLLKLVVHDGRVAISMEPL